MSTMTQSSAHAGQASTPLPDQKTAIQVDFIMQCARYPGLDMSHAAAVDVLAAKGTDSIAAMPHRRH